MLIRGNRSKKGFTLIELLVVISIIAMLSSVVLAAVGDTRKKARDSRRVSDMNTIQTALEMYYSKYGYYPDVNDNTWSSTYWYSCKDADANHTGGGDNPLDRDGYDCNGYRMSSVSSSWSQLQSALSEFLPRLPVDPINNCTHLPWPDGATVCYTYFYGNVGRNKYRSTYDLGAVFEDTSNPLRSEVKNYNFYFNNEYLWNRYENGKMLFDISDRFFGKI